MSKINVVKKENDVKEKSGPESRDRDRTIHLTFSTTAGDYEDDFPLNQPLNAVKRRVMAHLHLDPSKADEYVVTLNGNVLDDGKTLRELHIPENSILILERKDVVKI